MFEFVQIVDPILGCGMLMLDPPELDKGIVVAASLLPASPNYTPNHRESSDRRYGEAVRLAAALGR